MKKPWIAHYPSEVPAEITLDQYTSLNDLFLKATRQYADKKAFYCLGQYLTFANLATKSACFASFLQYRAHILPGERVAIMLPNCLQYPIVLFGALQIGAVIVNVNPLYTARELVKQLKDAAVSAIVVLENFAYLIEKILNEVPIKNIIVTQLGDLHSLTKRIVINTTIKWVKGLVPRWSIPSAYHWHTVLHLGAKQKAQYVDVEANTLAFLQYTGGTTGTAKGAMLTHGNLLANIEQISLWANAFLKPGQEIILTALPLYHIFAMTANCLVFLRHGGCNLLIPNARDLKSVIATLKKFPVTVITGVNTLFNGLLLHPKFTHLSWQNLKLVFAGGMPLHRDTATRWYQKTGVAIVEGYGLTEASPVVAINRFDQPQLGTVGLPLPSTDVQLLDSNGVIQTEVDGRGELLVRGPQVMNGYWQNTQATLEVLTAEGWLHTGDIATIDAQGYLRIIERQKDMILVSGFNVYPNEVEEVLLTHPEVREAAVVGLPDAHSGEAVTAFIVKKTPNLDKDGLLAYCRSQLAGYKIPKEIHFLQELPKSNIGKVLRRVLRENHLATNTE